VINPFYEFTLTTTGAPLFIDVTQIGAFYRYIPSQIPEDEDDVETTIVRIDEECSWSIVESPKYINDCINELITANNYGFKND